MCREHTDADGIRYTDMSATTCGADLLDGYRLHLSRRVPCGLLLRHGDADAIGHPDLHGNVHRGFGAAAHLRTGRIDAV